MARVAASGFRRSLGTGKSLLFVRHQGEIVVQDEERDDLVIAPVPALVALLLNLEQKKGSALTEAEVLEARDNAACIAMPRSAYRAVSEARGYDDIDPERVWEDWLDFKASLDEGEGQ